MVMDLVQGYYSGIDLITHRIKDVDIFYHRLALHCGCTDIRHYDGHSAA